MLETSAGHASRVSVQVMGILHRLQAVPSQKAKGRREASEQALSAFDMVEREIKEVCCTLANSYSRPDSRCPMLNHAGEPRSGLLVPWSRWRVGAPMM